MLGNNPEDTQYKLPESYQLPPLHDSVGRDPKWWEEEGERMTTIVATQSPTLTPEVTPPQQIEQVPHFWLQYYLQLFLEPVVVRADALEQALQTAFESNPVVLLKGLLAPHQSMDKNQHASKLGDFSATRPVLR